MDIWYIYFILEEEKSRLSRALGGAGVPLECLLTNAELWAAIQEGIDDVWNGRVQDAFAAGTKKDTPGRVFLVETGGLEPSASCV